LYLYSCFEKQIHLSHNLWEVHPSLL
jgi:hypothetical protein